MVQNIEIKNIDFKYVDQKMKKEILEYVSTKVVEVFRRNILKVYSEKGKTTKFAEMQREIICLMIYLRAMKEHQIMK